MFFTKSKVIGSFWEGGLCNFLFWAIRICCTIRESSGLGLELTREWSHFRAAAHVIIELSEFILRLISAK